jgi:hypothetical protein
LYESLSTTFERLKLSWNSLIISVTTDGWLEFNSYRPGLCEKNARFLSVTLAVVRKLLLLRWIIHQEVHFKNVLNMNRVTSTVDILVNFVRASGLNHRFFISLLQDLDAEHADAPYDSSVRWLRLG